MLFFEVSKDTVAKVEKDLADPESTVFPANSVPASSGKNNMKDPTQPGAIVLFFEVETPSTHLPVQARAMDVRCFEEESSDTIIYCFCAGLETVKGAVVNPEVETPSTPVSPCATSGLRAPSAAAAPIKCSGGTTEPDAISDASK